MALISLVRAHVPRAAMARSDFETMDHDAWFRSRPFALGARTTRRDREVVEIAMGHRFHGAVESRYARGDLLDERRELLDAWARYLDTPPAGAEIIPLRRA